MHHAALVEYSNSVNEGVFGPLEKDESGVLDGTHRHDTLECYICNERIEKRLILGHVIVCEECVSLSDRFISVRGCPNNVKVAQQK